MAQAHGALVVRGGKHHQQPRQPDAHRVGGKQLQDGAVALGFVDQDIDQGESQIIASLAKLAQFRAGGVPVAAPADGATGGDVAAPVAAIAAMPQPAQRGGFPWVWAIALGVAIIAGFLLGRSAAADWWIIAVLLLALVAAGAGFEAGRRGGGRP